jgi:hypothetical protein
MSMSKSKKVTRVRGTQAVALRKSKTAQTKVIPNVIVTFCDSGKPDKRPNQYRVIDTNVTPQPGEPPKVWVPADKHVYEFEVAKLKRQHNCSHRKGAAWNVSAVNYPGVINHPAEPGIYIRSVGSINTKAVFPLPRFYFDFNVSMHTFPDSHQEIKCLTCKRVWKSGDADFQEALKMVQNSTNKPSASEVALFRR